MALPTAPQVRKLDLGGSIADLSDEQIDLYIGLAAKMLCERAWGRCFDQAVKFYTLHLVAEAKAAGSGAAGPVVSASAGGLSVSYANSTAQRSALGSTKWGQLLAQLWDACGGGGKGGFVVRGDGRSTWGFTRGGGFRIVPGEPNPP